MRSNVALRPRGAWPLLSLRSDELDAIAEWIFDVAMVVAIEGDGIGLHRNAAFPKPCDHAYVLRAT